MSAIAFEEVLTGLPRHISRIHTRALEPVEPFLELARRFAHLPGTVVLLSGGQLDCARYNVLGVLPWLTLPSRGTELHVTSSRTAAVVSAKPFDALQTLLARFALTNVAECRPLAAGLLGYLAYDLKDQLEELPRSSSDDLRLPDLFLAAPSVLIVEDRRDGTRTMLLPQLDDDEADVERRILSMNQALGQPSPATIAKHGADATRPNHGAGTTRPNHGAGTTRPNHGAGTTRPNHGAGTSRPNHGAGTTRPNHGAAAEFVSDFSREDYLTAVEAVRDYIVRGHVYQVNLSQRYAGAFAADPYDLFVRLFAKNPAPFFAYVNAGDHQIVSTSPERFLLLQKSAVETRPIKGTRPRGKTTDEDQRFKHDLETSPKDDAELSMIVDLLRNDIGKVCRVDSVHVDEHKRVEAYENVYHLVSIVRGVLDEGKDAIDLVRATFPGGSITGCPKIRAMEIIDELEPVRRHVYTGSIGYLGFDGNMDLSIAIRTATITQGKLVFSVGGGIVYDSKPGDEFEETLHKGRTLIEVCGRLHSETPGADGGAPSPAPGTDGGVPSDPALPRP